MILITDLVSTAYPCARDRWKAALKSRIIVSTGYVTYEFVFIVFKVRIVEREPRLVVVLIRLDDAQLCGMIRIVTYIWKGNEK